jgi:hypothetical protein
VVDVLDFSYHILKVFELISVDQIFHLCREIFDLIVATVVGDDSWEVFSLILDSMKTGALLK